MSASRGFPVSDEGEKKSPVLEVKDGGMPDRQTMKLLRGTFLDPQGPDYMGSGLSFSEWFATADVLRYNRWFGTQTREEQQRRMRYVIALCAEQERLVAASLFACGTSQGLIEKVIEGDWNSVKMTIETLRFNHECEELRTREATRFAKFVALAQEAYDTRPKVFCPVCTQATPRDQIGSFHDGRHVCPRCQIVHDDEGNWVKKDRANLSPVEGGG